MKAAWSYHLFCLSDWQWFEKNTHCQGRSGCGEAWWEYQLAWSFWKAVRQYVSKATSFDIVFLLLGIYLKGLIWQILVCTRIFNSILFIKPQGWRKLTCPSMKDWLNQLGENWWYKAIFINFWTLSYSNLLWDGKIKQNKAGCKTAHVVQPYIWETQIVYICMYAKKKVWDVVLTVVWL